MPPSLPQHDPDPAAREQALAAVRERYVYDLDGLPPFALCAALPDDEALPLSERAARAAAAARLPANLLAVKLRTLLDPFDELQDYDDLLALVARPAVASIWRSDEAFAEQRLSGGETRVLRRIDHLPDNLPLDPALFHAITGASLADASFSGRLFLADYAALHGLPAGGAREDSRFLYAPLALFHWADDPDATRDTPPGRRGTFMPVAIQLDQSPTPRNLYTPRDGVDWLLARTVVQNADAVLSLLAHHLGRMHLGSAAFAMATARQLGDDHPIGRLLRPHLRHALAHAEHVRRELLAPGGPVDRLCGPTLAGSLEIARYGHLSWRVDAWSFPRDLELRGLDNIDILPHYPWRDDGRLVWDAVAEFVAAYVHWAYPEDRDLADDPELHAWLDELRDPARGNLRGLPRGSERPALTDLLANILFTAGPCHSALNACQAEYAACVPNYPLALYGPVPAVRGVADESHLLRMLPPQGPSLGQLELVARFAAYQPDQFGHYEPEDGLDDPPEVHDLIVTLQEHLVTAEQQIHRRNAARAIPYAGFLPSKLANSASV